MSNPHIALFGTSADPPTIGHAAILTDLAQHYDRVAVWAADNPFKSNQTPLEQRHQMLQLLIDSLKNDHIGLFPQLSHPRTWFTLEAARQLWPQAEFTLVIGADLVPQITTWYRAKDLLQSVQLRITPRAGYPLRDEDLAPIVTLGTPITLAQITPPKAASSEYRKQGQRSAAPDLPPSIQAYIEREQLYA
jgi:nicotinate-nucleotide adenylyltransferase